MVPAVLFQNHEIMRFFYWDGQELMKVPGCLVQSDRWKVWRHQMEQANISFYIILFIDQDDCQQIII